MPRNLHTHEIRYFSGKHAVKELPPEEWDQCLILYPKCEQTHAVYMRGYEVQEEGILGKKGNRVRIAATTVFAKRWPDKVTKK